MPMVSQKPVHVLLIDDDEDDYLLTRRCFKKFSDPDRYHLEWIDNFEDARTRIREQVHDTYLVDYNLGPHTGLDLIQDIQQSRELNPGPIIMLTNNCDPAIDMAALKAGATDFISKLELEARQLERSIRYALSRYKTIQELRESERRRQLFVASLTHDLRSPIKAELSILEYLLTEKVGTLTPKQKNFLAELEHSNRFVYHMINTLLTTYRYDQGIASLEKTPVQMDALVQEMTQGHLQVLARDKNIHFEFESEPSIPPVLADEVEIRRVIYNLGQNAINYSPEGSTITITLNDNAEGVWIHVIDQGPGIEAKHLPNLFQPHSIFRPLRGRGTGLGLYLSKKIVEAHDGFIGVETKPYHGSRFYFCLPAAGKPA